MRNLPESLLEDSVGEQELHPSVEMLPCDAASLFEPLLADLGADQHCCGAADLAAAVIHEISQSLTAILTNAQAGIRHLAAEPANRKALSITLQRILRDTREASQTMRNMRVLFVKERTRGTAVDLRSVVEDVFLHLSSDIRRHTIKTYLFIDAAVRPVAGNRLQLLEVVTNLMVNAIESMEHNSDWPRELEIRVFQEDGMIRTEIADRGTGVIDCEKIFEAFFTTKEAGMGMGLRICRMIIEAHEGRLWAYPRRERGTVFTFSLPLAGIAAA